MVCDERLYEAIYLVEYDLPPSGKINDCQTLAMAQHDAAFRTKLRSNPMYGNVFVYQTNAFFYNEEPPSEWKWKNTRKFIRKEIIYGFLKNRGKLAIRQKEKLMKQIYSLEKEVDRTQILQKCNNELEYVWHMLDTFSSFDVGINKLCVEVDCVWSINPFIRIATNDGLNPAGAA